MASVVPIPRLHAPVVSSRPTRTKEQRETAKKEVEERQKAIESVIDEVGEVITQACLALAEAHNKTPEYYRKEILGMVKTVKERAPNKYNMFKEFKHANSCTSTTYGYSCKLLRRCSG